jgi:hypothetical protein
MNEKMSKVGCVLLVLLVAALIWMTWFLLGGCNPQELNILVN